MKNIPPTKIPALLALGFTMAGSLLVINQHDARQGMANIQINSELPQVQLAADYKPCGNTIKCPPPPADYQEKESSTEDTTEENEESSNSNQTSTDQTNEDQSETTNYTPAPGYNPSASKVKQLEADYSEKIAPIIDYSNAKSIEEFLQAELAKQSTVVKIYNSDGQRSSIKNDRQVAFINNIEDAKELRKDNKDRLLIIDPSTDSDGDRIADLAEILFFSTDPFKKDTDSDGISDSDEIDYGTSASTSDTPNIHAPGITNLHGITTDSTPIIKGIGLPGEELTINAYTVETGETFSVCAITVDKLGKFACQPDAPILDGTYYLYSNHTAKNGKESDDRRFTRIEIKNELATDEETAEITEVNKLNFEIITNSKITFQKYLGSHTYQNYILKYIDYLERTQLSKKQILSGKASPSEIILVTWQSYSLNSVLIADSSGQFETSLPAALEHGEHKAFVYNYDTSTKFLSFISRIVFNKS